MEWKPYKVRSLQDGHEIETGIEYSQRVGDCTIYSYITEVLFIAINKITTTDVVFKLIQNTRDLNKIAKTIEFVNNEYNLEIPIPKKL